MPFLKIQQGDLYYHVLSQGPLMVFVNDWVLSHAYWMPLVRRLSRSYGCVIYDPRGVGRSTYFHPEASYAIETHAEDLHQLIVSLQSGYVHLVGHGIGGVIAGLCMKTHPQDVRTLTLIATDSAVDSGLQGVMKYTQSLILLHRLASVPLIRSLILRRYALGRLPDDARKEILADFSHLNPQAAWETMMTALEDHPQKEFMAGLSTSTVPSLFVACGQDKLSSTEGARGLFDRVTQGRLVTMHTAGHFPMLEFPDKLAQILEDFHVAVTR
jgi:proline iminopeptidase